MNREGQNCLQSSPSLRYIFLQKQISRRQTLFQAEELETTENLDQYFHTKEG